MSSRNNLRKKSVRRSAAIMGILFLILGALLCWFWVWPMLSNAWDSKHWLPTECEILSSSVEEHSDSDSTTYSVKIRYAYIYEGNSYESDRYDFMAGSSSGYADKLEIVSQYPVGSMATAYVNPADPAQATLVPGLTPKYILAALPVLFVFIGLWMLAWAARGTTTMSRTFSPEELSQPSGELKPAIGPLGRVLVIGFLALLWNGIVFAVAWNVFKEWQPGSTPWKMLLVLAALALAGLYFLVMMLRGILQMANPRLVLTLAPFSPLIGDTVRLDWRTNGDPSRIERLRLLLEVREETVTHSGKNTRTKKTILYEEPLLATSNSQEVRSGSLIFNVPGNLPATFDDYPTQIVWEIKARASIPRWPDVEDDFPIVVRSSA